MAQPPKAPQKAATQAATPVAGKAAPKAVPAMTDAQRAYETRRAAKAGLSLEKWLAAKEKERQAEKKEAEKAAAARVAETAPPKPPGLLRRLLDRAQQPLKR